MKKKKKQETFAGLKQPLTKLIVVTGTDYFKLELIVVCDPTDNLRISSILIYKQGCNVQDSKQRHSSMCLFSRFGACAVGDSLKLFRCYALLWLLGPLCAEKLQRSLGSIPDAPISPWISLQTLSLRPSPLAMGWRGLLDTFICNLELPSLSRCK